jgi:uncharacterized membrane protein YgdD (TMEM256/DUF423 family)
MNNIFWKWGLVFAGLSVALGAMGAHSLKNIFPPESLSVFETGVRYQFYHAFAILLTAFLIDRLPSSRILTWAGRSFVWGIILFSGSLYLLAAKTAGKINFPEAVGIVTPLGGLLFILGWSLMLIASFKK